MTAIDRTDSAERLARIEQMIEKYRALKERKVLQRTIRLLRKAAADQQLVELEAQPERIH